ncbi:hypothetical protein [Enterocloster clostridioformis]|uniref:hypothetical protein n=1 Tax=Enterocloster clostridioformis TaxID=1531 RepID=UPI000404E2D2|nr:hypothetical protein [Enterocloster clostridioformis]
MDTNKKILIGAIGAAVVIGGVAIGLILSKTPEKADLSTIHTQAATEAPKESLPATTQAPETDETTEAQEGAASSVSASIETYTSGKISIQYPAVDQLDSASKKDKINELLKTNALSVIKANDIDEANDTLDIKCKVISVDRKRLTATYTGTLSAKGAAHPVNLFYSNTVNLLQAQNLGLDDFTDAYTMAGYVLSDDVKFSGISSDVEAQVLSYLSSMDLDSLTAVFNSADFPLSSETQWPESFSYEKQGTIYFSLPVPHALGDYVLVAFDPTTK